MGILVVVNHDFIATSRIILSLSRITLPPECVRELSLILRSPGNEVDYWLNYEFHNSSKCYHLP